MYLKILRGGENGYDPHKLSSYLLRESANAEHVSSNLFIEGHSSSAQVADAFSRHHATHASRSGGSAKRIKRPLVHIIARAAPQDGDLDSDTMKRLSRRVMEELGLDPESYPHLAQSHTDEDGVRNHIHIVASRIPMSGKSVWYGRREGELCWKAKTALEKEFDLHRTESMEEFKTKDRKSIRRTAGEQQMKKRGVISDKEIIAAAIVASLEDSQGSWAGFESQLQKYQIEVLKIERSSGRHGVVFLVDGMKVPGSKIGRSFSYAQLSKSLQKLRAGQVKQFGDLGIKVDAEVIQKHAQSPRFNKPKAWRKKLEFDKSQLEDLRKVERGRYPDLSAVAKSLFATYPLQQRNPIFFILSLIVTRSMVSDYKRREAERIEQLRQHRRAR